MSLKLHHLQLSQSERIVWMLEEMELPYELIIHQRDPVTALAPESLKAVTPAGTAPYFEDTSVSPSVSLIESGAVVQYILEVYQSKAKGTKLSRQPGDPDYGAYLEYLHFANGSLQPNMTRAMTIVLVGQHGSPVAERYSARLGHQLQLIDDRLSKSKFLAGDELSAADIMTVFSLTTMRGFSPRDLTPYTNILRYLGDIAARPAYKRALEKGDNNMKPMIEAKTRRFTQFKSFADKLELL